MKLAAVVLVVIAIVNGAKIFVDPIGSDAGNCGTTQSAPCQSLFFAINISSSGDTIYLAPGLYPASTKFAQITHDLIIAASVPQEGPPIINYEFECISTSYSIGIFNTTGTIAVTFEHITFANLNCQASSNLLLPSILYVESNTQIGIPSVQLTFRDVTFEMNNLVLSGAGHKSATKILKTEVDVAALSIEPGLVGISVPAGMDPVALTLEGSLFSGNQAIGLSTYGTVDIRFYDTPVYNTSFYNYPAYYLIEPRKVNISACAFTGNLQKDNPLSSFLFVNGSSPQTEVTINNCYFKNAFSPAIRFQGEISLSVNNTAFYALTNVLNGGSEFFPPYVGTSTAISYNEYETNEAPTGDITIEYCLFDSTGLTETNKTDGAAVALAGFKSAQIRNCDFVNNGVIGLALVFSGQSGSLNIENSYFSNNTGRGIVLTDINGLQFKSSINNCTFNNNGNNDPVHKSAVYFGGFAASNPANVESEFTNSIISGSSIGVFAGPNELVELTSVAFDVTTTVQCVSATLNLVACTGTEEFSCDNCSIVYNSSPVCPT